MGHSKNLSKIKRNRKLAYTLTGMDLKTTERTRPKGFTYYPICTDRRDREHSSWWTQESTATKSRGNPNGQDTVSSVTELPRVH